MVLISWYLPPCNFLVIVLIYYHRFKDLRYENLHMIMKLYEDALSHVLTEISVACGRDIRMKRAGCFTIRHHDP